MAEEAVTVVLQTVRDLLIGEINFLRSVSKRVAEVQTELTQMHSFLKDADSRQIKEEGIRNLVKEIRHLAYRIENVLETYAIKVASRKEGLGIQNAVKRFVCILGEGKSLHKVGLEIENIKTRLSTIRETFVTDGITSQEGGGQCSNAVEVEPRQTYAHEVEEYFVGMAKDINQIVSFVTDEERAHRVISIHGMGGLGKTTLARKIYNHINVQRCYQGFAWVSISKQFKKETIFLSILKQLLKDDEERKRKKEEDRELVGEQNGRKDLEKMDKRELVGEQNGKKDLEKMDERELVEELYKVQKDSKCLVVLDDIWEIKDWNLLSPAFPFKEANSKILMTTRNRALAEKEFAYELSHLSEDECWDLLRKKAFSKRSFPVSPEDAQVDPQFKDAGREMIHKCGRLPLAISVLGGILNEKSSLHDWRMVNLHFDAYLRRSEDTEDGYGAVSQVLALSYDSLPYHLKPCFLYLGHFREDQDIDVERLYQMWIAEGMILSAHRGKEETSMHVAEYYLSEMAQRSMVQVKVNELSITRRFKSCRLHDLVRDFCLVYGGRVEFLQVLDFGGTGSPLLDSSTDNPCRFSIHNLNDVDAIPELYKVLKPNDHLRSLLLYGGDVKFPQKICHLKSFKFLRVLNIFGYTFETGKLPKVFKMLIHLKFLSLHECELYEVQAWIGNFPHLQTLELRRRYNRTVRVPNVLWKLKQLRHLYLPGKLTQLRVYGLSKLETLANIFCDEENLSDLSDLINLRRLHVKVWGDRSLSGILNHLNSNRHKLEEVRVDVSGGTLTQDVLACLNLHHLRLNKTLCKFQDLELSIPSNLIVLKLKYCYFGGDPMEALGKLSSLRNLTIGGGNYFSESSLSLPLQKMICHPKSFLELRYLTIGYVYNLRSLVVLEGAMPKLSYLEIDRCKQLEMIPAGLRFITGIKELRMEMPKTFNDRVRVIDGEEGVDFHKISHIPLVSLTDARSYEEILAELANDKCYCPTNDICCCPNDICCCSMVVFALLCCWCWLCK